MLVEDEKEMAVMIMTTEGKFLSYFIIEQKVSLHGMDHILYRSMWSKQSVLVEKNFFSCFFSFHYIKLSGSSFIIMQGSQTETTKNCLLYSGHKSDTSDTIVLTQSKILLHNIKQRGNTWFNSTTFNIDLCTLWKYV